MEKLLHLLKEFPGALLLAALFCVVLVFYVVYNIPFLERLLDLFAGGILSATVGSIVSKRTSINAESVQTPAVNTASMDNATINAESVGATSPVAVERLEGEK